MFVWNLLRCEVRPDIADQKWFSRIVFTLPPLPLLLPPPLLLHNLPPLQLLPHHLHIVSFCRHRFWCLFYVHIWSTCGSWEGICQMILTMSKKVKKKLQTYCPKMSSMFNPKWDQEAMKAQWNENQEVMKAMRKKRAQAQPKKTHKLQELQRKKTHKKVQQPSMMWR